MTTESALAEKGLVKNFIYGLHGFILNWIFLNLPDFYEKNLCKKKKVRKNCFDEQEKSRTYLEYIAEKSIKYFKAILAVLGRSKSKIFSVGRPCLPTFFRDLGLPNYFSATTALFCSWYNIYHFQLFRKECVVMAIKHVKFTLFCSHCWWQSIVSLLWRPF